jgi:transcription elongation factor GreA
MMIQRDFSQRTSKIRIQNLTKKTLSCGTLVGTFARRGMTYEDEFQSRLAARDYNKVLVLWQEYCENDELDVDELVKILRLVKESDFAQPFGQYVEAILPLVMTVSDGAKRFEALRYIYDLETSNSQALYELAHEVLKGLFAQDPQYQEKLRLVGLRTCENFQGALSNFLLLNHIAKNNFVYNDVGWGVGEIVNFSFLREQITVDFENLGGATRDISFKNAFHSLIPLPKDHFLVLRFVKPEELEKQAGDDSVGLVTKILHDVGPKGASDIKDLLVDYVIPADKYSKWWQSVRSRLKKDGHIELPQTAKDVFVLRASKLSHDERLDRVLAGKETFQEIFPALYSLIRDFPTLVRDEGTREEICRQAKGLLAKESVRSEKLLQIYFLLEQLYDASEYGERIRKIVTELDDVADVVKNIDIVAMRKRFLQAVREFLPRWPGLFSQMMLFVEPAQLKDYILKELSLLTPPTQLISTLRTLLEDPASYPEAFLWYFQKVVSDDAPLNSTQADQERFFESFLLLLATLERRRECKDVVRKMLSLFTGQRFKIVRNLLKGTDIAYAREFLLLASKCQSLDTHDQKILHSLFDVVHGIPGKGQEHGWESSVVWTTEEGYRQVKERIQHIGTVEVVENAREIEEARAHGDLRENAEYKAALERRSRLQHELKALSDQFNRARIITTDDISTDTVGIGTKVTLESESGTKTVFTILGPWDANPEENILSDHSKLAQSLLGKGKGSLCEFRGESVTIARIESFLPEQPAVTSRKS